MLRRYLRYAFFATVALGATLGGPYLSARAGPEGGEITGGSADIEQSGTTTTIRQNSDRAIIRWNKFDVEASERVEFRQPSRGSIAVNRITDSKASRIDGSIKANGNIILINPNGVVFGSSAIVDVGGLVATTSDLKDDNAFMAGGPVEFTRPGKPDARIINRGSITVGEAGLVGLVAPHVENSGMIRAKMGKVALASGDLHTIDFAGDGLIKIEVSDDVLSQSVTNSGSIEADGGHVLLTAAQARTMVESLIVNTGTIRALTVNGQKGRITLSTKGATHRELAGAALPRAQGVIENTGALIAEGSMDQNPVSSSALGGDIALLADSIRLGDGSVVSAAGDEGGGTIRIGGDYQGSGNLPTSSILYVEQNVILNARSRRYGKGGTVILWSDDKTVFYGNAYAGGGDEGGDGGLIEVSGKNILHFDGHVDLSAAHGEKGILLLDPTNIVISAGADAAVTGASPFMPDADDATSVLNITTLLNALASANVIVQTRATGGQLGNITVDSAISWTSGTTLTLDAHGTIIVNQAINANGGNLTMIAGTDVQFAANISGTGTLALMPAADGTAIGIGSGAAGVFNVNATDFPFIQNGWGDIIVGRSTGSALMDVRATTWSDNLTLQTLTGGITVNGIINSGANNLTLMTNGDINLALANALTGTGTLNFRQQTAAANVGISGAAGALNLNSTDVGRIVDGWAQINIGRADGSGTMTIGTSSVTWRDNVTFHSGTGAIAVSGAQTFGANAVSIITDGDLSLTVANALYASGGTLSIAQRSIGTTIGLGDAQAGDITLSTTEITRLRDGFTQITIGRTDGTGAINIGNSTWVDPLAIRTGSGAINVNASTVTTSTNALSLTTEGGNIAVGGAISQTSGALSVNSGGGTINITAALSGTTTGAWSFDTEGGALTVSGNITKTSGSVAFTSGVGQMIINNALSFGAASSSFTVSGGTADITLNNTLAASTGSVVMTTGGGDIVLAGALTYSGAGGLTLTSNGGLISTAAITQTTGATSMTSGGGSITVGGTLTKTGGATAIDSGAGQLTLNTVALGAGSLALTTDSDVALNGNLSGTSTFAITQASNNFSLAIGTGQSGTILIDDAEFARIQNGWSSRTFGRADSTASLNVIGGLTWDDTLVLQTGSGQLNLNGTLDVGGNNLTLRTDSDVLIGGTISGSGTLAIVQASAGTSMGIGDGQAGALHISTAENAFFGGSWSSRTYGRTDGTNTFNVGGISWSDTVTLRTGSGQMNINGTISMGTNALVLSTDSDLFIGANVTGSGTGSSVSIIGTSAATSIGVGDGQAGDILLSNAELTRLGTTWNSVVIGTTTSTGTMNVGGRTWSDPLTLRTGSGQMNINGAVAMGSNNLTLSTDSNLSLTGTLTGTGTVTIAGAAAATSIGVGDGQGGTLSLTDVKLNNIINGWGAIVIGTTSMTGSLNVGARTWTDPLTLRTASGALNINGAQVMGSNNLTLTTNGNISLGETLSGTGSLTITGSSNSTSIGIGTGQSGTLSLSDAELDNILSGWTSVIFGSTSLTGAMNIAGRTWNNSVDFRTGTGALNINGAQNMGTNNLIIRTATDLAIGYILAGTGTLSIMNSGTASGNTMAIGTTQTGQLKLTDAEIAFFSGQGWGTLAFGNTGAAAALSVDAKSWNSHVIFRNGAATLSINGTQTMAAGKNLTINSNGDIALNQAVDGTGTLTFGPTSATSDFGVGDGQAGTVHLSNAELARIGANWSLLSFGTTATTNGTYGAMNVGNLTWNHNVRFFNNLQVMTIAGAAMGAHNLTIETNTTLNITDNLSGTETLTLAPQAAATSVGVGGTGTFNLTEAEMLRFSDGWGEIVIGRVDGSGAMNVAARTWTDDVRLMTGSGLLTIAGATMGANNLTLVTNSNLTINGNLTGTGALAIRTASGLTGIGVGDIQTGTLALANAELVRIVDGWGSVTIGGTGMFGDINIGAYTWVNPMTFITQGDVVLNGVQTSSETSGTSLVFATTAGSFINTAGASAINPGGGRYLVYSVASADDTLGGLAPLTVVNNQSYSGYPPGSVTETGDVFLYSGLAAKILFLSIDDKDKVYGDANPAFTYTYLGGLQGSDTLNDVVLGYTLSAPGSTVLDGAGTTRTITGSFTAGLSYTINVIDGLLSVIKATLTVTGDSDTREYGDANPALSVSYSGFKNGEDETDINTGATVSTLATLTSNAGNYAITASGAADDNYDFIYVDGTLNITKATLTATTQNATREYGDANPAFTIVYTGFKNSETSGVIDTLAGGGTAATGVSNVGTYGITGSGALDNNYDFTYVNSGILTVTKATLTATTQNASRAYGDANPGLSVVYTGFKNGEGQGVIDTLATASTLADPTYDVGSYAISATGAADSNYSFTYANTGLLSITKAMLTVTGSSATRQYGDANPALSVTYSGFKNGQNQGVIDTLATVSTLADPTSDAGNYAITATGAADSNYDFAYVNGTLTIGKVLLTASVTGSGSREYGAANPAFGVAYTGFVNGDDDGDINALAGIVAPGASANVGTYAVSASGALDNNYDFTYVDGTLSITKAMLTATADNATREEGEANPAFNISYTGFRNGENASVIDTPATAASVALTSSPIGTYAISPAGALDNNYDFIYIDGVLSVTAMTAPPPAPPPDPPVNNPASSGSQPVSAIYNPQNAQSIQLASSRAIFTADTNPGPSGGGMFHETLFLPGDEETRFVLEEYGLALLPADADAEYYNDKRRYLIGISRALLQ